MLLKHHAGAIKRYFEDRKNIEVSCPWLRESREMTQAAQAPRARNQKLPLKPKTTKLSYPRGMDSRKPSNGPCCSNAMRAQSKATSSVEEHRKIISQVHGSEETMKWPMLLKHHARAIKSYL